MNRLKLFVSMCCFFVVATLLDAVSDISRSELKSIIKNVAPNAVVGFHVISPTDSEAVSSHSDRLFTPASCLKLFTAAAALHLLRPEFSYKTLFLTPGKREGSTIYGDLCLKASGDPSFTQCDLAHMVARLKSLGIEKIVGDVCLDISVFEDGLDGYFAKGGCFDDKGKLWSCPITSFIIDHNYIRGADGTLKVLDDPHQAALAMLERLLASEKIRYSGILRITNDLIESGQILVCHRSKPLSTLLTHMLKNSDNLYANAIFKFIGSHEYKAPGTWQKGKQAMAKFLTNIGINPEELVIEDGAGVSRYNLVSPCHIVSLLTWIYNNREFYAIFLGCLPLSAMDGALKNRMSDYPGVVRAKTGTMTGVTSLSGYICVADRSPLIFSILTNNIISFGSNCGERAVIKPIDYKVALEDELCKYLIKKLSIREGGIMF